MVVTVLCHQLKVILKKSISNSTFPFCEVFLRYFFCPSQATRKFAVTFVLIVAHGSLYSLHNFSNNKADLRKFWVYETA